MDIKLVPVPPVPPAPRAALEWKSKLPVGDWERDVTFQNLTEVFVPLPTHPQQLNHALGTLSLLIIAFLCIYCLSS